MVVYCIEYGLRWMDGCLAGWLVGYIHTHTQPSEREIVVVAIQLSTINMFINVW
jgi:hypothetical protein